MFATVRYKAVTVNSSNVLLQLLFSWVGFHTVFVPSNFFSTTIMSTRCIMIGLEVRGSLAESLLKRTVQR